MGTFGLADDDAFVFVAAVDKTYVVDVVDDSNICFALVESDSDSVVDDGEERLARPSV